jgi:site-specific recombinase XerC
VFTTRKGTPIKPRNINRTFDTLIAKSALREYVFMIFGNSCATLLFVQGGDHQTIKDLVGHSSIGVTSAIYVDDAVDRLSQLFDPDNGTDTAT